MNECTSPAEAGLKLARAGHGAFRRLADRTWFIPCDAKIFVVRLSTQTCSCGGYASAWCSHLWAVAYVVSDVTLLDGTRFVEPPVTDARDWLISLALEVGR